MDYEELAKELIRNMRFLYIAGRKENILDSIKGEFFVLHFVRESQGKTVPSSISNAVGISSARVAAALNSLEDKELITRRIDSEDRRKIIVELTPKGMDFVQEKQQKATEKLKSILMLLGEEDSKALVHIVGRLGEVLSDDPAHCDR